MRRVSIKSTVLQFFLFLPRIFPFLNPTDQNFLTPRIRTICDPISVILWGTLYRGSERPVAHSQQKLTQVPLPTWVQVFSHRYLIMQMQYTKNLKPETLTNTELAELVYSVHLRGAGEKNGSLCVSRNLVDELAERLRDQTFVFLTF